MHRYKTYRCSNWFRVFLALGVCFFVGSAYGLFKQQGYSALTLLAFALVPLGLAALLESFSSVIQPEGASLIVRSGFKKKVYEKADIVNVKLDGGSVIFEFKSGSFEKIPDLGRNSRAVFNTLRAWHKNA